MKLFKVKISGEICVLSSSLKDAEEYARLHSSDISEDLIGDAQISASEITAIGQIPVGWENAIPWGDTGEELTINQRLKYE